MRSTSSTFLDHVLSAGYHGPLSLEVFNDVFRQSDPARTAVDALRSLIALQDATNTTGPAALPPTPELNGYAFAELSVDQDSGPVVAAALESLGFARTGQHRSKPVERWSHGEASVLLNATPDAHGAAVAALGVETTDPKAAERRAEALLAPALHHPHDPGEAELAAVAAPDGTEIIFCHSGAGQSWTDDFEPTGTATPSAGITHIDHVALTQPFDQFDEAALFYRSLLGLGTQHASEIAAPFGLVRNRVVSDRALTVRLNLSVSVLRRGQWGPGVRDPQHVAFACDDVVGFARRAREAGAPVLEIPDNYYDDLDARFALAPELLAAMRANGVLYDRDAKGEFRALLHRGARRSAVPRGGAADRRLRRLRRVQRAGADGRASTAGPSGVVPDHGAGSWRRISGRPRRRAARRGSRTSSPGRC